MTNTSAIREHMEVIGADGVHVGTVDRLEGDRIKLAKKDSGQGSHEGHHHYISTALIAEIEGDRVRLSANANVAVVFEGRRPMGVHADVIRLRRQYCVRNQREAARSTNLARRTGGDPSKSRLEIPA